MASLRGLLRDWAAWNEQEKHVCSRCRHYMFAPFLLTKRTSRGYRTEVDHVCRDRKACSHPRAKLDGGPDVVPFGGSHVSTPHYVAAPGPGTPHWDGDRMTRRGRRWCARMGWRYIGDPSMGELRRQKPHEHCVRAPSGKVLALTGSDVAYREQHMKRGREGT